MARWCFRHRRAILAAWLLALVGCFGLARVTGTAFASRFQLSNTPSARAQALLAHDFPAASGSTDQIVLHARSGSVRSPAVEAVAERMLRKVGALPHVRFVLSPYSPSGAAQIDKGGTIAFATVTFDEPPQEVPTSTVARVVAVAQTADTPRLHVAMGGADVENAEAQNASGSTGIGIVLALIVLGLAFGAFFASLLPLVTALVAIGIGYALTGLLSHAFTIASFATVLGLLIGLGVGVDYALFIVTRHRTGLRGGRSPEDAAVQAVDTAGRAVLFAGVTVCIALLGQFALGISFLYGVAVSAAITVALTMLASLTLLPALLGFFGPKVLSRRQRKGLAASGPTSEQVDGPWRRWAEGIERHPVVPAVVAVTVVVVLCLPFFSLRLGLDDAGSDAAGTTTRQAYDLMAQGFGPGFNGPFVLVGELPRPDATAAFVTLTRTLAHEPGVASVGPPRLSPTGTVAVAELFASTSPQSARTSALLSRLRDVIVPRATAGTGLTVLVGGATASQTDFSRVLSAKLPLFVAVVIVLAALVLVAVFRSLMIPVIASVMNLASIGAALGIMNAVFNWGWGHAILGLPGTAPVQVFVPVLLFSILFGLSMDYEVFLVSRMHEEWVHRNVNGRAVTLGQAETGRVITAAAAIMILVFVSFVFGGSIVIKQFGVGLSGAVFIDAFVIRTVLIPSLMHLAGRANWWLPGWLDRVLPRLHVEAAPAPGQPGVGVGG